MATAKAAGLTFSDYMRSLVPGLANVVSKQHIEVQS